ncbi:MAG: serine hydrolase domain-containing protein [Steroidobacteraceae bacterium]
MTAQRRGPLFYRPITRTNLTRFLDQVSGSAVAGLQYVVVHAAGTLFDHAGGWADIRNQRAMTCATTLMAYSMTKTFTAAAILQLVEHASLALDNEVDEYLPDSPYVGHGITIRQLLDHTSGIPNPIPLRWVHLAEENPTFDERAALAKVLRSHPKLTSEPGKRFAYSNIGYWLLGTIVEHWLRLKSHYVNGPAFGGLVGTAHVCGEFLQDQLRTTSVLLGTETKRLFESRQTDRRGKPIPMTLGWHVGEARGVAYLFKEGGGGGFHSEMRLYPRTGIGSVVMVNSTEFNSSKFLNRVDMPFFRLKHCVRETA